MSTLKWTLVFFLIINFWLVFGWQMPVPELVRNLCWQLIKGELWVIGLSLVFVGLFFYDQMVLVVERHQRICGHVCRIGSRSIVPWSDELSPWAVARQAKDQMFERTKNRINQVRKCLDNCLKPIDYGQP